MRRPDERGRAEATTLGDAGSYARSVPRRIDVRRLVQVPAVEGEPLHRLVWLLRSEPPAMVALAFLAVSSESGHDSSLGVLELLRIRPSRDDLSANRRNLTAAKPPCPISWFRRPSAAASPSEKGSNEPSQNCETQRQQAGYRDDHGNETRRTALSNLSTRTSMPIPAVFSLPF